LKRGHKLRARTKRGAFNWNSKKLEPNRDGPQKRGRFCPLCNLIEGRFGETKGSRRPRCREEEASEPERGKKITPGL